MVNGKKVKGWKWNAAKATISLTVSGQKATSVSIKLYHKTIGVTFR
ncbi:hypothetical protein [Williamwhitmania taraxaci]|nr:hypothetical protein [Williamwhitmania taraxaci]